MDDGEQPHLNNGGSLCLPPFWVENLEAWFGIAEARFRLCNIEDEQVKFDLVVNSLRTVLDLVTDPPKDDPYEAIKDSLCEHHNSQSFNGMRSSMPWMS
jgi:hypothetical protein